MRKLAAAMFVLLAMAGTVSMPALAAKHTTQLYATTMELHFTSPSGKTRTITEQIYIDAGHDCTGLGDPLILDKHPELKGWTLTNTTCKGSAGTSGTKSNRPGGAAAVVLLFIVDGQVKKTATDHSGTHAFDMSSCALDLSKYQEALVAEAQHQFSGGKFVGAHCIARPKYLNSFNSN
jgi:hypothetical protein